MELSARFADLLDRSTFPLPGAVVVCAVSGGADSLALMVLARAAGCVVTAIHVDHGLRPGSGSEAELVAAAAARFGAAFEARTVRVEPGANIEARARGARYAVLPTEVLTGHTADDQAETVLMFLMRGTGPDGLAGIDPARRPMLGLRRSETEQVCRDLGLDFVSDPTNNDRALTRNRVRHELLPLMTEIARRDVVPLVARTAALQSDALTVIEELADGVDPTDARALGAAHPAVARAALRNWWRAETGSHYTPDAAAIERVMDVATGRVGAAEVAGGWRVDRTRWRLRLSDTR